MTFDTDISYCDVSLGHHSIFIHFKYISSNIWDKLSYIFIICKVSPLFQLFYEPLKRMEIETMQTSRCHKSILTPLMAGRLSVLLSIHCLLSTQITLYTVHRLHCACQCELLVIWFVLKNMGVYSLSFRSVAYVIIDGCADVCHNAPHATVH